MRVCVCVLYICEPNTHFVHEGEHLQCQHILSEIISMFGNDLDEATSHCSRIFTLKFQPQRTLVGGASRGHMTIT